MTVATPMPVLRWMGNKSALLGPIRDAIARCAPPGSLLVDPFAGSHAVSAGMKDRNVVIAADAQVASATVGHAFVENRSVTQVPSEIVEALAAEAGRTAERPGYFEATYAETYLGTRQCRELDALRGAIDHVLPDDEDPTRALALCALMVACCRAQASPGHFAQFLPPDHPRTLALRRVALTAKALDALASFRVEPGRAGCRAPWCEWSELVAREDLPLDEASAWYLDPPYTRDQYSRFYHFLETVVLADEPAVAHGARYRDGRFRSAFCTNRAAEELARLLDAVREVSPRASVVLSYSSQGLLSREELLDTAGRTFRVVSLTEHACSYSTQGRGRLRGVHEWLVTLAPR